MLIAAGIYALATLVFVLCARRALLLEHTTANHFALQAEAWLHGHLHLNGAPPAYAGGNDFARFEGQWYVVFPPFPAVLLLPFTLAAGGAIGVRDGRVFLMLAGVAPAALFLALEKLRRMGLSPRTVMENASLALLFAFGTVYFFTAVQGTVWYAAHVVGTSLAALYLLFSLGAERPLLAGTMIALGFLTRVPLLFAVPLFLFEAWRVHGAPGARPAVEERGWFAAYWHRYRPFIVRVAVFSLPVTCAIVLALVHNAARFGRPLDFGYQHLEIAWHGRIEKWGLFHYHYLARNLGVLLSSLPYVPPPGATTTPIQINGHGLALWVTSPFLFWLLWPARKEAPHGALWVTTVLVALPALFYQNTGWVQFGQRFSNDYAVFLMALLAIGGRRLGVGFCLLAAWSIAINSFGALTFQRPSYRAYYYVERTQRVLYQPD